MQWTGVCHIVGKVSGPFLADGHMLPCIGGQMQLQRQNENTSQLGDTKLYYVSNDFKLYFCG